MANFRQGNILNSGADIYCFTANSIIKANGELVMGAGVAKDFYTQRPALGRECANIIRRTCGSGGEFNLIRPIEKVIALQTKRHWKFPSDIELVKRTIEALHKFAFENSSEQIAITYLGTLNGGLDKNVVHKLLENLPDNITVWQN